MIDEISVHNLALIRDASLEPCDGLTIITGETGAGKTALLTALKLLMGVRASADMVRDGEDGLVVSGRFFGLRNGEAFAFDAGSSGAFAEAAASEDEDQRECDGQDETVVVRRVSSDGRSRATVDGQMTSMKELAELVSPAIDLCGQFEHQQLMKPANHVRMLDAWAGDAVAGARQAYDRAFAASADASAQLQRVREAGEISSAKLDEARFILKRINEVNPQEGEYEQLAHDLHIAEHAESLAMAASAAYEALSGDDGALDRLNAAASALDAAGRVDANLAALAQSLREVSYVLEDVSSDSRDYRDRIDFDPDLLASQQDRFSQMQGLLRAYGPRMEDVFAARDAAEETVSLVDDSDMRLAQAERAYEQAEKELSYAADALDDARSRALPEFQDAVTQVMGRLQMGGAQLVCEMQRLERKQWTSSGPSSFEFLYRPGAGMQARPLARIASGGEVSRVMLAVKVVLGSVDDVQTLVFDEVDAGVGGSVAVSLADVIADLARTHQVIVVTHLAQVAVRGQAHYVVRRHQGEHGPETQLQRIDGDEREAEIARMLSGSATEASLTHARELLSGSQLNLG